MTVNDLVILMLQISALLVAVGFVGMLVFMIAKKTKLSGICAAVMSIGVIAFVSVVFFMSSRTPEQNNRPIGENGSGAKEISISEAMISAGYTKENAEEIQFVFESVGIVSVEIYGEVQADPNEGLVAMSCYPNGHVDDKYRFICTTDNGAVIYVGFLGETLYDAEDGGVKNTYGEIHIPETDVTPQMKTVLSQRAETAAQGLSNFPDTVKVNGLTLQYAREDNLYSVSCEFSCKNAFGVKTVHHLKLICEVSEDGTQIRTNEVYLDGVRK